MLDDDDAAIWREDDAVGGERAVRDFVSLSLQIGDRGGDLANQPARERRVGFGARRVGPPRPVRRRRQKIRDALTRRVRRDKGEAVALFEVLDGVNARERRMLKSIETLDARAKALSNP